jgi:electron transport complex protein RnfB
MDESIEERPPSVARIRENECIGCTLCIQACPVDAILGAAKQMHTVIESECTGCELCLPPCPVECIVMEPIHATYESWSWPYPMTAHRNVAQAQEAS